MSNIQNNKGLNISIWIAQVILGAIFLMAGVIKSTTPIEQLSATIPWTKDLPWLVRFIGISELAGGAGLLLPSLLKIKPTLTPIAALGLLIIMLLAIIYHILHREFSAIGINIGLALVSAFIAWGRFKKVPISVR